MSIKLSEYIKELQEIELKYPDSILVSASDEEGNSFSEVYHSPSLGNWDKKERKFICFEHFQDYVEDGYDEPAVNAICIN